jgi:hypothetical protein
MIKTLTLTARTPHDENAFALHLAGPDFAHFIWDWEQKLRSNYKYLEDDSTTWEKVRELWYEVKADYKLPEAE